MLKLLILVLAFYSVCDQYKTQGMRDKAVSNDGFLLKYCVDRYKTQAMCDEAIDDFLPAFKFNPHWFVTSKMMKKKLHDVLLMMIYSFDDDSGRVTFFVIKWVFLA